MTIKTIWCLFDVAINYDQPDHNLVRWWSAKPTMETLAVALGLTFPGATDEGTLLVVKLWQGERVCLNDWAYFLKEVPEGEGWKP